MAKLTEAQRKKAIAKAEGYKPKPENEDDPANGAILWHLNRKGLIPKILEQTDDGIVTKIAAWQAMLDATLDGVDFS